MLPIYPENKTETLQTLMAALGYDLSPINLSLSIIILIQNSVIIKCYIDQKVKFSAAIYIAIAVTDIVVAVGSSILSVAGMLVADRKLDLQYLYYCFYFWTTTAGLAQNCSKHYNAVLSTVIMVNASNPFRRLNFRIIRLGVAILTAILAVLHLSDGFTLLYMEISKEYRHIRDFHRLTFLVIIIPGGASLIALLCLGLDSEMCYPDHHNLPLEVSVTTLIFLINVVLPPLILLISAILLVVFLRRAIRGHDSIYLTSSVRHVSITVLLVATLAFVCHFTLGALLIYDYFEFALQNKGGPLTFKARGRLIGCMAVTLPLLNAAIFPSILISRNPTLREKFLATLVAIREVPGWSWLNLKRLLNLSGDDSSYYFL